MTTPTTPVPPTQHAVDRTTAAIDVQDLHKNFGANEVLKGIDFHVAHGQVVCVIGPSGSGKSTLLRCVNMLETPTSGKIFVEGEEITDHFEKKPIHMKVVFRATDGMVALMISAALSLPCIKQQQQHISGRTVFFFSRLNPDFRYVPPQLTSM